MVDAAPEIVFVYTTLPDSKSADTIAEYLVRARLAACVNIFKGVTAIYEWQGTLQRAEECAVFIKTRRTLAESVIRETRARHPYDTPIFAVLLLEQLNKDYLAWALTQTSPDKANPD